MLKFLTPISQLPTSSSQRGASTIYVVIILVVIIFAVMLSGGSSSLLSGDLPTTVTETPIPERDAKDNQQATPTATPSAGTITPTPTNTAWTVSYVSKGCIQEIVPYQKGELTTTGLSNGYITIEVINGSTSQRILSTQFSSPQTIYDIKLSNKDNFHNLFWRVNLYEGGTGSESNFTGGTLKATYNDGSPTGC